MESFVCTPVDEPVISDEVRAELRRMEERLKIAIKSEILIELASQSGGVGTLGGESGTSARKDEEAKEAQHEGGGEEATRFDHSIYYMYTQGVYFFQSESFLRLAPSCGPVSQ